MVTGMVSRINSKPYNGKMLYSVKLSSDDRWFGLGAGPLNFKEGDTIEFDSKTNAKGYHDALRNTLKVLTQGAEVVSNKASVSQTQSSGVSKEGYWDRKEARDARQDELREIGATRNTALEFIKVLLSSESISLPTKKAEREGFLQDLLDDYINRFRSYQEAEKKNTNGLVQVKGTNLEQDVATTDAWN